MAFPFLAVYLGSAIKWLYYLLTIQKLLFIGYIKKHVVIVIHAFQPWAGQSSMTGASVLPFILLSTPSSDLCFTWQQLSLAVQKSFCVPEEEKLRRMEEHQEYLQRAKKERIYYNTQIAEATEQRQQSGEKPLMCHYSFDFTQQAHFPFDCQPSGPDRIL